MNLLLANFLQDYGLLIMLVVIMAAFFGFYYYRNKKYQQAANDFQTSLKKGDKVKTYSGFYGTIEKITETTDGKVVTLKLSENNFVDMDMNAIYGLDNKTEVVEEPVEQTEEPKAEVSETVSENVEEVAEEPAEEKLAKKSRKNNKSEN